MADQEKDLRRRATILKEIEDREKAIAAARANSALNQNLLNRYLVIQEEKTKNAAKELKKLNQERLDGAKNAEEINNSLTGLYKNLSKFEADRIAKTQESNSLTQDQVTKIDKLASINRDIAKLTIEDVQQHTALLNQYRDIEESIGIISSEDQIILDNLAAQNTMAASYGKMTKTQKQFLEKQLAVYDGIKDTIGGILETASLLTSNLMGAMGAAVMGVGMGLDKWGKSVRSFGGYVDSAQISTFALGFAFKDAEETAKGLSKEFGGLKDVSFSTQLNANLMATNMGISGAEAANVVGNFARMNEGSAATAMDMAATTKAMGKAAGVPIDSLMKDVAGSSKAFAEYGKDGGLNIAKAAVAAAKLGVGMDSLTKVTDSLLDFETSINSEMELGAMLGKQLNLDRARGLAYEGNIGGAVKETLQQLGGIEEFNKMDIFQKRKAAELLGLSVDEFQKMAANSDKLNDDGTVQLSKWDSIWETMTGIATGPLGKIVTGFGSSLIAVGQMGTGLSSLGVNMGGIVKSSAEFVKNIVKAGASKVMGMLGKGGPAESASQFAGGSFSKGKELLAQRNAAAGATPAAATTPAAGGGGADQANKFGKIKASDLIKGAAALLILAAALWVSAKAFQEFATVKWEDVGKGLVGLVGLATIAYVLGKAQGEMIKGAIAVALLGVALIPFAFAMSLIAGLDIGSVLAAAAGLVIFGGAVFALGALMFTGVGALVFGAGLLALTGLGIALIVLGTGLTMVGSGFSAISSSLPAIMEQISAVSQIDYMPILGLAGALSVLAFALAAVAVSGMLALPALMALGLVAGGAAMLFGGGEGGDKGDRTGELIDEIKGLRADLSSGKISVHMDGQKVTSKISSIVDKGSSNSYGKR
jgi:hypothetical protein